MQILLIIADYTYYNRNTADERKYDRSKYGVICENWKLDIYAMVVVKRNMGDLN